MTLDAATLFLVLIGLCLISAAGLAARWRRFPADRHLAYWSAAFAIGTLSLLGLGLRDALPAWLSIIVANGLALTAFGIAWMGVRVFGGRQPYWWPVAVLPTIWIASCSVPVIYASQPFRTALASSLVMIACLILAIEVWRRGADQLPSRAPLAALCLIHAIATGIRALAAFRVGRTGVVDLDPLFVAFGLLEPIFVVFGVMMLGLGMTQQRRELALSRKASIDSLTGLLNRGTFLEQAAQRLKDARHDGRSVALLVFDIDFFKEINDNFGHAVGDRTLVAFADAARQVLRSSDPVGRMGGEEFAVLLVGAGREVGASVAERIRAEFSRRTQDIDGARVQATVSAGISASHMAELALETMMVRGDEALYAAKRGGRDLVWQAAE